MPKRGDGCARTFRRWVSRVILGCVAEFHYPNAFVHRGCSTLSIKPVIAELYLRVLR